MIAVLTLASDATNEKVVPQLLNTYDSAIKNPEEVHSAKFRGPSDQKAISRSFRNVAVALMAVFIICPWLRMLKSLQSHALPSREEEQEVDTSEDIGGDGHPVGEEDEKGRKTGRKGFEVS